MVKTRKLGALTKRAVFFMAAFMLVLTTVQSVFTAAAHATSDTWVDGAYPQLTVGPKMSPPVDNCFDVTLLKHSYLNANGTYNPLGRDVPISVCVRVSELGLIGGGYVSPDGVHAFQMTDSTGRGAGLSVYSPTGNVYLARATPFFGPSTYLSFTSSLGQVQVKNNEDVMVLPQSVFTNLKDSGGNDIIKMPPTAFSSNGQWMVFYAQGLGSIRLNVQTKQMTLFDKGQFNYDLGFQPSVLFAISDDGNTVIRSGAGNFPTGSTAVYDLSGCVGGPFVLNATTNSTAGCKFRHTLDDLRTINPNFVGLMNMEFTPDGMGVRAYADIMNGSVHEIHIATYAVAGYQMPFAYQVPPAPAPGEPEPPAPVIKYLALGDSFSSGEGAFDYIDGTDEKHNNCHTSYNSYPYVAADHLGLTGDTFHTVACSGAVISNYLTEAQHDNTSSFSWLPGEEAQQYYIRVAKPNVVTISMVGNDIGFSDKIKTCLKSNGTCFKYKEDRQAIADEIYSKFDALAITYMHILRKSEGAKLYVMGYPQIMDVNGPCGVNTPFEYDERDMAQGLITYLNAVIESAAEYAGAQYIDVDNAFEGHKLCQSGTKAVNGLTAGNDIGIPGVRVVGNESFHPNSLGNQLMADQLLAQSHNFTTPNPAPNTSLIPPYVGSYAYNALLGNAPSNGSGYQVGTYNNYDGLNLILKNSPTHVSATKLKLYPNYSFQAVMFSTPTPVGTITTDADGYLSGDITVPSSVEPGLHTLHLTGKDIGGRTIDLYKTIYIAETQNDLDGDGTPNDQEKCLAVEPSGIDFDRDGIDDACDAEISEVPADTVAPTVTGAPDRAPNENGWYNADVTINWSATDPDPSSGAPTQPAATTASQEGEQTYTSDQSCDPLNNCATGSLTLKIDKSLPQISYSLSPAANGAGWNTSATTVTFNCNDAVSGVASCSAPQTVSGDDGSYIVTGDVTDNAGNTNSVNAIVNLDSTKPTVTQSASPAANSFGWNNTDVTVTPTCGDNLSGVLSCDLPATVTTEGANQAATSNVTDNAGNTFAATTYMNIDKTAPTLGAPAWANNPKAVSAVATITVPTNDNLSGITAAEYFLGDTDPGVGNGATMQVNANDVSVNFGTDFPTGVYKVTVRTQDKAGNWSLPTSDYLVVYSPDGTRMTGRKVLIPGMSAGDILPGLVSGAQTDKAKFGFNVRYDDTGNINPESDMQFKYETGSKCNKPELAVNCHSFDLNATSIAWLTTQGTNNSTGIFQGTATLKVDGTSQNVAFRLTGVDGALLDSASPDHLVLKVYALGANPDTATPLYQVSQDVERGNIKIRTQ